MRLAPLLLLAVLCTPGSLPAQIPEMGVDPRVELLSIIFRLAGNPEYNQGAIPAYEQAIAAHFAPYREHEAVRLAAEFRQQRGVSFDAVMSMAIHLSDAERLEERVPFDAEGSSLERRWGGAEARRFVAAARRFVVDARFAEFRAAQRHLYDTTDARLRRLLVAGVDYSWFSRFFGAPPGGRFVLVPGLANGGGSYGPRVVFPNGLEELYAIIGVFQRDSAGLPRFTEGMVGTVVHEFNHSYVNPVVAGQAERFEEPARQIYDRVMEAMRAQAYGNWETMVNESLVRAAVIRYLASQEGVEAARRAALGEEGRGFYWTSELASLLGSYEAQRERYPDLASFLPRVAEYFTALAPRVDSLRVAFEASRPRLVAILPDTVGGVDPRTSALVLVFDRPMMPGYSLNILPGARGGPPAVSGVAWDASGTRLTFQVSLTPGTDYAFRLNSMVGGSFRSAAGVPLAATPVVFRTRAQTGG
jgi:hypothetical protein